MTQFLICLVATKTSRLNNKLKENVFGRETLNQIYKLLKFIINQIA